MLIKSPAIVLGSVKYGDSSIILRTFTREAGLRSFIAGGLQSKKGPLRPALVQPLSQLNLIYYDRSKGELKRLKDASVFRSYQHLFYDPVKSSLAMFLAEVLSHVLHEEEPDPELFDFISESLLALDGLTAGIGNFHLAFLMRLTFYLGFKPEEPPVKPRYFDLLNGVYSGFEPPHFHFLNAEMTPFWLELQALSMNELVNFKPGRVVREKLLHALIEYYRLHVNDFGKLKSLDIVKTLLSQG